MISILEGSMPFRLVKISFIQVTCLEHIFSISRSLRSKRGCKGYLHCFPSMDMFLLSQGEGQWLLLESQSLRFPQVKTHGWSREYLSSRCSNNFQGSKPLRGRQPSRLHRLHGAWGADAFHLLKLSCYFVWWTQPPRPKWQKLPFKRKWFKNKNRIEREEKTPGREVTEH